MKAVFFCLVLGVVLAPAQVPENSAPTIALYVGFQHEPPGPVLESMEKEVGVILSPMAAHFEWRSLDAVSPGDSAQDLAVAKIKGKCNPEAPPLFLAPGSLGFTHVSDGVVLPFCEVDCDRIRSYLGVALSRLEATDRAVDFGRAVGRVLAHEFYHIFAHTREHELGGLGKPNVSVRELMAAKFRLEEGALPRAGGRGVDSPPVVSRAAKALFASARCGVCHGDCGEGTARGPRIPPNPATARTRASLAAWLNDTHSRMYLRAAGLKLRWPALNSSEVETLAGFLKGPR